MKQPAFLANAHDGFGVSFATTVACILSIVAISWHPWSQSEMLISEEHNPESSTDTYDAATNTTTTTYNQSGSEAVWGTQYLAKCPNCKKSSRLVMTRSPMDWCVSLRQVVFQPYDHRRRRMDERSWASSRLETHTNYTVWTNTSCVSDMEGSYVDDNFCNATWVDLRKDACDRADAAIASWPNATAYPYAFWRWVKRQCDMYENVCLGTGTSAVVDVAGVAFMFFAMVAALVSPFSGDYYKVLTVVTAANLAMGWLLLFSAISLYGKFNASMNAPRELYARMLVYGEGTFDSTVEPTVFGRGVQYTAVRDEHYTSYPALRPAGPIATYLDAVIDSKTRWDWSPWLFSMGFFVNVSAIMWTACALVMSAYRLYTWPAMKAQQSLSRVAPFTLD